MRFLLFLSFFLLPPPMHGEQIFEKDVPANNCIQKESTQFSLGVALGALVVLGFLVGVVSSNSSSSGN